MPQGALYVGLEQQPMVACSIMLHHTKACVLPAAWQLTSHGMLHALLADTRSALSASCLITNTLLH